MKNGQKTLFWKDIWLYDQPLYLLFPDLFAMCEQQDITVGQVLSDSHSVTFSRWLVDKWKEEWEKIVHDLTKIQLSEETNYVTWKFGGHGHFSVKSVYNALTEYDNGPYNKRI